MRRRPVPYTDPRKSLDVGRLRSFLGQAMEDSWPGKFKGFEKALESTLDAAVDGLRRHEDRERMICDFI